MSILDIRRINLQPWVISIWSNSILSRKLRLINLMFCLLAQKCIWGHILTIRKQLCSDCFGGKSRLFDRVGCWRRMIIGFECLLIFILFGLMMVGTALLFSCRLYPGLFLLVTSFAVFRNFSGRSQWTEGRNPLC